jgi:hypothetical protein
MYTTSVKEGVAILVSPGDDACCNVTLTRTTFVVLDEARIRDPAATRLVDSGTCFFLRGPLDGTTTSAAILLW